MPIYEYNCPHCRQNFEEWLKSDDDASTHPCPICGASSPRIISHTSFILKGGGWYVTEYGSHHAESEDGQQDAAKESAADASTKTAQDATAGTSSEGKAATAAPEKSQGKSADKPAPAPSSSPASATQAAPKAAARSGAKPANPAAASAGA